MFDCIVVGLGVSGLCQVHSFADKGFKTLGLEQFPDDKCYGSSQGLSRITRQAYFLEPNTYMPLIKNSYKLWEELEKETGIHLFNKCGVIYWDDKQGHVNKEVIETSIIQEYPITILNQKEALVKEPFFKVKSKDYYAVVEKDAGILYANKVIEAKKKIINQKYSKLATLKYDTKIVNIYKECNNGETTYVVVSSNQEVFKSKYLILAAGSWIINMFSYFPGLAPYRKFFKIENALVIHYKFKDDKLNHTLTKPFYISRNGYHIYGFPNLNDGNYLKLGIFHFYGTDEVNFEHKKQEYDQDNFAFLEKIAKNYIKDFSGKNIDVLHHHRCTFTMTKDEHYVIDRIPFEKNAFIVSACSGHGFKFQNTIGDYVVDLILKDEKPFNKFRLTRFDKELLPKF